MISVLLTVAAVLAAAQASPAPAARHDLDRLLAKPVSPGVIALLLPHARDPRAAGRVTSSLSHADAKVRAAAARAVTVADLRDAAPVVRQALAAESDRSAAAEQFRAVILFAEAGHDLDFVPVAAKHGILDVLAHTLAVVRGPAALPAFDAMRAAGLPQQTEGTFFAIATRRGQKGLDVAAAAALRAGSRGTWHTVLGLAREAQATLSPALLLEAIEAPKVDIRAATYWHLALEVARGKALSPDLEAALARAPEGASSHPAHGRAAFAFTLLRRARGAGGFGEDWGARAAAALPFLAAEADRTTLGPLLTAAEARAVSLRLTDGSDGKLFEGAAAGGTRTADGEAYGGLSFAAGLPPGTLRDVLAVSGCKPGAGVRALGIVEYAPDGRPRRISVDDAGLTRGCAQAAGPAIGMTLAPPGLADAANPARRTVVIIPLDKEALACADEPEPSAPEPVTDGEEADGPAAVKEPRKVKNVPPAYPPRAMAERRQGVVILDAVISPTGCIRSVRVDRSVAPDIDAAAMIAVGQWRYTPTLLRGKPVPVMMTVTVNFRLSPR